MALYSRKEILDLINTRIDTKLLELGNDLDHSKTMQVRAERRELVRLRDEILATEDPVEQEIRPVV